MRLRFVQLHAKAVCDIPPSCFTRPDDSDNLPSLHTIVSCYWITELYSGQLGVPDLVPVKQRASEPGAAVAATTLMDQTNVSKPSIQALQA